MIGETIRDKYRVLDQINEGHLVTNFLTRDQSLNEMVVLKLVRPKLKAGSQFLERFSSEAKKLKLLTTRQALKALDWGELETGPYAIFEYTGGKTLADVCQAEGALSLERALDIAAQLGLCLADAHEHALLHGDLRPDNILLGGDGQVKVTNFGLAWSLDLGRLIVDGTLERDAYHAPELSTRATLDNRTDMYSLGAILFEILTGRRPALIASDVHPVSLAPGLPAGIDHLVACCLAQDPDDRPKSAFEFLEKIDEALHIMSTAPGGITLGREEMLAGHTLGPYRLMEKLGRGGMATVYKAYDPPLERYVAIKILPQHFAHDPAFITRFQREAKAIAHLNHPNIVPIFNFGKEGDLTYIVVQYVPGGTLKDLLGRPMASERAVRLVIQIARALSYAHKRDVVHRDIKPANVLMAEEDRPLLSDFGLARMMSSSSQLTQTGVGLGTPAYMSPEQGQGLAVDGRSDIYSLGILLYEMLTGHVPFQADTPLAVVLKHITSPLPMPREVNPHIPESMEQIILKATAKDSDHRFRTADEMIEAMERALASLPVEAPPTSVSETIIPTAPPSAVTQPPTPTGLDVSAATEVLAPAKPKRSVPVWVVGLVGVLVIVGLIAAMAVLRQRGKRADQRDMEAGVRASPTTSQPAQTRPAEPADTPTRASATPTPPASPTLPPLAALTDLDAKSCAWEGMGSGLCIYSPRGGRPIHILEDSRLEITGPSWSPDGDQIAFSALKPGGDPSRDQRIFIVNTDGSGLTELPQVGNDIAPAWSPDGKWLAFHSSCGLAIMHPDGSEPTLIWEAEGIRCIAGTQWSPDGQRILTSMLMEGGGEWKLPMTREVWSFSRDDGSITRLATTTYTTDDCVRMEVAFSPDATRVAYIDDRCGTWLVNADGSGSAIPLVEFPVGWTSARYPQWADDIEPLPARPAPLAAAQGKIVEVCQGPEPPQICVRDAQTHQVTQLTEDLKFESIDVGAWSPDGQHIAFNAGSNPEVTGQYDHKLYLIKADGSGLRQISRGQTNDIGPAWSPDGSSIAFHRSCDLWIARLDGSGAQRLLPRSDVFCAVSIAWSPDSQRIAFFKGASDATAPREIWVTNRDGTAPQVVYVFERPVEWASVAWSPDGRRLAFGFEDRGVTTNLLINADGSGEAQPIDELPESWLSSFWPQWGEEKKTSQTPNPSPESREQIVVPPGEPVRLAFVGALSGDVAQIGEVEKSGMLMALEDLPAVKEFPIDVAIVADGGCTDTGVAQEVAERVASDLSIAGVIGHTCSASCKAGIGIYEGAHMVMISPSCSAPLLSQPGYQVFNRVVLRDDQGGDAYHEQVAGSAAYATFAGRYRERYHAPLEDVGPGTFGAYAYDATLILIQAIQQVAEVDEGGNLVIDRQALARAVRATTGYNGVTGTISFDEKGDRLPP